MKRFLALLAASALATGALLTAAAPAHADGPTPQFGAQTEQECLPDGTSVVTWTLTSTIAVKITGATLQPPGSTTDPASLVDLVIPNPGSLVFDQHVPMGANAVSFTFNWVLSGSETQASGSTNSTQDIGQCAKFTPNCDGTVDVDLVNPNIEGSTDFFINGVKYTATGPTLHVPGIEPDEDGFVTVTQGDAIIGEYEFVEPEDCATPTPSPTTSPLPVTGASLTGVAGTGIALVLGGVLVLVVLFLLRRRRHGSAA